MLGSGKPHLISLSDQSSEAMMMRLQFVKCCEWLLPQETDLDLQLIWTCNSLQFVSNIFSISRLCHECRGRRRILQTFTTGWDKCKGATYFSSFQNCVVENIKRFTDCNSNIILICLFGPANLHHVGSISQWEWPNNVVKWEYYYNTLEYHY